MKTVKINGKEIPVLKGKAVEEILNKRTGKKYNSREEFEADVKDPSTDTTAKDLQINQNITVDSLQVFGKTM